MSETEIEPSCVGIYGYLLLLGLPDTWILCSISSSVLTNVTPDVTPVELWLIVYFWAILTELK